MSILTMAGELEDLGVSGISQMNFLKGQFSFLIIDPKVLHGIPIWVVTREILPKHGTLKPSLQLNWSLKPDLSSAFNADVALELLEGAEVEDQLVRVLLQKIVACLQAWHFYADCYARGISNIVNPQLVARQFAEHEIDQLVELVEFVHKILSPVPA